MERAAADKPEVHRTWPDDSTGYCELTKLDRLGGLSREEPHRNIGGGETLGLISQRSGRRLGKDQILVPGKAQSLGTRICGPKLRINHVTHYHLQPFPLPRVLVS